jgi:hypothetical protein
VLIEGNPPNIGPGKIVGKALKEEVRSHHHLKKVRRPAEPIGIGSGFGFWFLVFFFFELESESESVLVLVLVFFPSV